MKLNFRAWNSALKRLDSIPFAMPVGAESVITQWTGLHDKNGREIFDGDICQCQEWKPEGREFDPMWYKGVVRWGEYSDDEYVDRLETWLLDCCPESSEVSKIPLSCIVHSVGIRYSGELMTQPNTIEVIGNIFENPNLVP